MRLFGGRGMKERITAIEDVLDQLQRSVERIEIVTVVREPNTGMSADAYNGLRKQVIAAANERMAHLHQLAQFDASLKAGAGTEELASLVREWVDQAGLELVADAGVEDAFELVGAGDGPDRRVVRAAYLDGVTRRIVRGGIVERVSPVAEEVDESSVPVTDGTLESASLLDEEASRSAEAGPEDQDEGEPSLQESATAPGGIK
jgi:hypothetical protein